MSRTTLEADTMNAESAVEAESDTDLMRAVIQHRDRRAFASLVERHQRVAFNLARHLTRTASAAEDVVQEALLRAWAAAGTFRREGSVRGWLLRIVAREAFRANRRQRAEQQRIERRQAQEPRTQEEGPAPMRAEETERLAALRSSLDTLSEQQRALLALYYGAELSQEEIGRHLELPQRTISRRLQEALDALRGRLAKAGMASAPLLGAEHLGAALLNAEAPPAGMFERFGAKLAHAGAEASRRVAAVKVGLPWAWLVAGALALVAVATAIWQMPSAPPRPQPADAALPTPEAASKAKDEDAAMEIVYEDEFAGTAIDPFWEKTNPAPRRGYSIVDLDNGILALFAGSKEASRKVPEGTGLAPDRLFPEVSIVTRAIPLDGRALLFQSQGRDMNNNAGYETYLEVLDGEGHLLGGTCQVRRSPADPAPKFYRFVLPAGAEDGMSRTQVPVEIGMDTLGLLADPAGEIFEVAHDGSLIPYGRHGQAPKSVRFRLRVKTVGEQSYMIWAFDRCRVLRVSDWNDPKSLLKTATSPWPGKAAP